MRYLVIALLLVACSGGPSEGDDCHFNEDPGAICSDGEILKCVNEENSLRGTWMKTATNGLESGRCRELYHRENAYCAQKLDADDMKCTGSNCAQTFRPMGTGPLTRIDFICSSIPYRDPVPHQEPACSSECRAALD